MGDMFSEALADGKEAQEEIRLRESYFEAVIACLQAARGKDGIDRALRKSLHAAIQSFRAYLAWQKRHEAVRNPIG